ncbi:D-glycero-beta-D-manno-heptose 1-phosphate adenylyltransferase [Mucilaginibacter sp. CAU 1740]|uniref:D-glycero-beta-D-manno-heptose 1-phosphate adenylyltransferase n=1 Tax=Mucilaginibacter sp. CAU 1740 TaxID=3140365 RepID=UPI00325B0641
MKTSIDEIWLGKIDELPTLKQKIKNWQLEGNKVVFTNGVFDLVHIGHLSYLAKSAELGHKLVVGVNADSSVKRIKGDDRPINHQNSRVALLAALLFIDAVILFDEDTPLNLIKELMPDILVKGADYAIENIVGGKEVIANGGEVKTINFIEGYSSTNIIKKISGQM